MSVKESKSFNINKNSTRLFKYSESLLSLGNGTRARIGVSLSNVNYIDENGTLIVLDESKYTLEGYIEDADLVNALNHGLSETDVNSRDRWIFINIVNLLYPICKYQVNKLSRQLGDRLVLDYLSEPLKAIYKIWNSSDHKLDNYKSRSYSLMCNAVSLYVEMVRTLKKLVEEYNLYGDVDNTLLLPFNYMINIIDINEWVRIPEFCNSFFKQKDDSKKVYMAIENGDIVVSESDKYHDKSFDSRYHYACVGVDASGINRYVIKVDEKFVRKLIKLFEDKTNSVLLNAHNGYITTLDVISLIKRCKLYEGDVEDFVVKNLDEFIEYSDEDSIMYGATQYDAAINLLCSCIKNNKRFLVYLMSSIKQGKKTSDDEILNIINDVDELTILIREIKEIANKEGIDLKELNILKTTPIR